MGVFEVSHRQTRTYTLIYKSYSFYFCAHHCHCSNFWVIQSFDYSREHNLYITTVLVLTPLKASCGSQCSYYCSVVVDWFKYITFSVHLYLRNKTYVPVFYCGNKIWVRVRCVWIILNRVRLIYFRYKSRVQMFYFDSNTTVPLHLYFWKAYVVGMSSGRLFPRIPITFHFRRLLNEQRNNVWINTRFQIFQFCDAYILLLFFASLKTF